MRAGIIVKQVKNFTLTFAVSGQRPFQALVDSQRAGRRIEDQSIYDYTEYVIFLGTPHRGSSYAGWGELAERIARAALFDTNRATISHLQVHGLELANLEKDFANLLDKRPFGVFNFQEALGFVGVKGLNGKVNELLL